MRPDTPRYLAIERDLRRRVAAGELPVGTKIASEQDLALRYGVSRMTLRHALKRLVDDGVLERRLGIGTFVVRPRIERDAGRLIGFAEDTAAQGMVPSTEVLEAMWGVPSVDDARLLGQDNGDRVFKVVRLRRADGEPLSVNVTQLTQHVGEQAQHADFRTSLYAILGSVSGVDDIFADQRIETFPADADLAVRLDVTVGACLLKIERVIQSGSTVLGLSRNHYRGDRYTLIQRIRP